MSYIIYSTINLNVKYIKWLKVKYRVNVGISFTGDTDDGR